MKRDKKILSAIISLGLVMSQASVAFAGQWTKSGKGRWQYIQDNSSYFRDGWKFIDGSWYYFSGYSMLNDRMLNGRFLVPVSEYDYYVKSDGKMANDGFCDTADSPGYMVFANKQGQLVKGPFMVDDVLYDSFDDTGMINKTYCAGGLLRYINSENEKDYIKIMINRGKVLKEDGTPFSADDEIFSQIKYLPKYDSKGNLLGAIQN